MVKARFDMGRLVLGGYDANLDLPGGIRLMTVNYYDGYGFLDMQMVASRDSLSFTGDTGYDGRFSGTKGLLTGSRTCRLDDPAKYIVSALYYDHRGRVVQTRSLNHLGGYDRESFAYTFRGKVKQRLLVHSAPGRGTRREVYTYSHDHGERLLRVTHRLNADDEVTLSRYIYDREGRLKTKKLHETAETTTYDYNIRGWTSRIRGTHFDQTLAYNKPVNGVAPTVALYNGNISAMKWKAGDETTERGYKFTYDGLDRLTNATYGEGAAITNNPDRFNETLSYDKTGNILALQRRGKVTGSTYDLIDNLTYTYNGNRLTRVSDAVTTPITNEAAFHFVDGADTPNEYAYDANGNLIKDLNKNITSITYNSLNLPDVVIFADGNSITYGYDAAGGKLSVTYNMGNGVISKMEYAGNKVYKNGTLGMILMEEGYITLSESTPTYYYYLKDHLGNNRVVVDQGGTVQQVNHYYPFGGLFGEGMQDSNQPYKYNGKEFDHLLGLNMYDYGARPYDPYTGGWVNVDPLAEKYYSISPYVYVANNPVRFIDPDGMMLDEYYSSLNGKYLGSDNMPSRHMRLIDDDKFKQIKNDMSKNILQKGQALQTEGNKITIDDAKIQSDLQSVADKSSTPNANGDYQEHQVYLTLDRTTATISSHVGAPGVQNQTVMSYYPAPTTGVNFADRPGGLILIGQAHGHPPANIPGYVTAKTMSPNFDVPAAAAANIPVYGIDAMDGPTNGSPTAIHRVTPSGTITNNVGKTSSGFNIGQDAMKIWGRRR